MRFADQRSFLVVTTDHIAGKRIVEMCGLARGTSVRSAPISVDVVARLKNLVGGEISEYTKIMAECREEALDRMIEHAHSLGANAVVGFRFSSCEVSEEAAEFLAYGTAVRVEGDQP